MVNYIESHDEAAVHGRIAVEADDADPASEFAYGRAKVAAALVLFSAGMPMLLQGKEWLESRRFGDRREHRIQWPLREEHAEFFRFIMDAIRLRRTAAALRASASQNVYHVNDGAEVIALQRSTERGEDLVIVVSLANREFTSYALGFPLGGTWFEALNGDAAVYGGDDFGNGGRIEANGPPLDGLPASAAIRLPKRGVLMFAREPVTGAAASLRGDCNADAVIDIGDAVAAMSTLFGGRPEAAACAAACDVSGDGRLRVTDVLQLLAFLFSPGSPPPAQPFPDCGRAQELSCARGGCP